MGRDLTASIDFWSFSSWGWMGEIAIKIPAFLCKGKESSPVSVLERKVASQKCMQSSKIQQDTGISGLPGSLSPPVFSTYLRKEPVGSAQPPPKSLQSAAQLNSGFTSAAFKSNGENSFLYTPNVKPEGLKQLEYVVIY